MGWINKYILLDRGWLQPKEWAQHACYGFTFELFASMLFAPWLVMILAIVAIFGWEWKVQKMVWNKTASHFNKHDLWQDWLTKLAPVPIGFLF